MNMSKSRDIQAKMPSPKVIFYAFWLVTVKVLNSYKKIIIPADNEAVATSLFRLRVTASFHKFEKERLKSCLK